MICLFNTDVSPILCCWDPKYYNPNNVSLSLIVQVDETRISLTSCAQENSRGVLFSGF